MSMKGKKKPGRFTLQFNLEDPQQRTVSELLEQQGRHKAQFITSAILRYIQCPNPQEGSSSKPVINNDMLEQMLLSILEKHPQFASISSSGTANGDPAPEEAAPAVGVWDNPIDNDTMMAISETLAAFQQGS